MFAVFFINFGYAHAETRNTVAGAIDLAKRCCFEANIVEHHTGRIVASYSPISGVTWRE